MTKLSEMNADQKAQFAAAMDTADLDSLLGTRGIYINMDRRVATLGDSRTDENSDLVTGNFYRYNDCGYMTWARFLCGQRIEYSPELNFGVTGDTTAQILARVDTAIASTTTTTWVVLAATNDVAGSVSAEDTIANLTAIKEKLRAAARRIIFIAEQPRGTDVWSSPTMTNTQLDKMKTIRHWLTSQADDNCFVIDPWSSMVKASSTNGRANEGMLRDGLHSAQAGAHATGAALAELFNRIFPPLQVTPSSNSEYKTATFQNGWFSSDQLTSNPMMTGTGGTIQTGGSGSLAANWTLETSTMIGTGSTLACVCSKVIVDGKEWQQINITGTAPNVNQYGGAPSVFINQFAMAGSYSAGQVLEAVSEIQIDECVGVQSCPLLIQDRSTFNTAADFYNLNSRHNTVANVSGVMRTPKLMLDATIASHNIAYGQQIVFRGNGSEIYTGNPYDGTVSATVRVRACGLRATQ